MAFSPPVLGFFVKKGLQKGGGVTGTPGPPLAMPLGTLYLEVRLHGRFITFHQCVMSLIQVVFTKSNVSLFFTRSFSNFW